MTDEKILAFFNMEKGQAIDKGIMQVMFWFDVSFSVLTAIVGLLVLGDYSQVPFSIPFILVCVVSDILFAIWLWLAKNPVQEHTFCAVVSTVSFFKLAYGSYAFSIMENKEFSIWYIVITVFFVSLSLFVLRKKHLVLQDLKVTTIEQARKNLEKKNKGIGLLVLPTAVTATLAVALSRMSSRMFPDVGLGFLLWALASIWLFFVSGFTYNFIVGKKYKLADIFSKQQ